MGAVVGAGDAVEAVVGAGIGVGVVVRIGTGVAVGEGEAVAVPIGAAVTVEADPVGTYVSAMGVPPGAVTITESMQ